MIKADRNAPTLVTLLPVPHFPLHALALCVDALRITNREALRTAFTWRIVSQDGEAVPSSAGIDVAANLGIDSIHFSPVTILLAAYEPDHAVSAELLTWLRRQDRRGGVIGCIDTGALVLARAGIAGREPLCIHRNALYGAREDYPDAQFTDRPFSMGRRRLSSAGGIATFDMMLKLIEHYESRALSDRVAKISNYQRYQSNSGAGESVRAHAHPVLARCVDLMHSHIDEPLSLGELSRSAGRPIWTVRRLFHRHLGCTPGDYYRRMRLERARELLTYSHLSLAEISAACGFADAASFSHAFYRRFNIRPSRARRDRSGLPMPDEGG